MLLLFIRTNLLLYTSPLHVTAPSPYNSCLLSSLHYLTPLTSSPSPLSSRQVYIDEPQIAWFEQTVKDHPAEEGWKIFVFSHAPPMGSGLRVVSAVVLWW
jgi:3',5'-cyclic AMP phosphodiesterase CpdA